MNPQNSNNEGIANFKRHYYRLCKKGSEDMIILGKAGSAYCKNEGMKVKIEDKITQSNG
jgi:hypothetical protein